MLAQLTMLVASAPIAPSTQSTTNGNTLVLINNSPAVRGGATIYDKSGKHSITIWGETFCKGSGCVIEPGDSYTQSAISDKTIGIQWNIYRRASDGMTCDNACHQIQLNIEACTFEHLQSGYCYQTPTPRWTPDLTTQLRDSVCTIAITEQSQVDSDSDEACGCEWGQAPCDCSGEPDSVCSGVCPSDSPSTCGSSDEDGCEYCKTSSNVLTAPVQARVSASPKVTVKNNCGNDTTVIFAANAVDCQSTGSCRELVENALSSNQNAALYVAPYPFDKYSNNNYGAATLAELAPASNGDVWVDISRVSGFNHGVTIKSDAEVWRLTCNGVNCKDAYWLCDNSEGNQLFSPNSEFEGALTITFCPIDEDDTNYFEKANKCNGKNPRQQPEATNAPYICQGNSNWDLAQGGTCVTGQVEANQCKNASPEPVTSCNE